VASEKCNSVKDSRPYITYIYYSPFILTIKYVDMRPLVWYNKWLRLFYCKHNIVLNKSYLSSFIISSALLIDGFALQVQKDRLP